MLQLTTNRPPDASRSEGIEHLNLTLPDAVAAEASRADAGTRPALQPVEAANLLWNTPAAAFLDGRHDACLEVPGVRLFLPTAEMLATTPIATGALGLRTGLPLSGEAANVAYRLG